MNIKSLILGSAAALFAAGAAQAADLPVAEPVDYVKVCDAYGAGFHFIPGTDTCLSIRGYVRAEVRFDDDQADYNAAWTPDTNTLSIWARGQLRVTAQEETELGTLISYIELESNAGASTFAARAWLSLGGLYAGVATSASVIDYASTGIYGGMYDLGDFGTGAVGYNMDLGNGVSFHIAMENAGWTDGVAVLDLGQDVPAVAARLTVEQGWGEFGVGAYTKLASYDSGVVVSDDELAYAVAAGASLNLDMLSPGSTFAVNGVYGKGTITQIGAFSGDFDDAGVLGKLNEAWGIEAGLKYQISDALYAYLYAGYGEFDNKNLAATAGDFNQWTGSFQVGYTPVKNFTVTAAVAYGERDFETAGVNTIEQWDGTLRLQRDF